MEPILCHGFPLGSSTGLVAAFEWLRQPYALCRVDMLADMKSDAFGRLNGRRETPVLITGDGRILTETMAIAAWLEARDTERRISFAPGSAAADRMHQLMAFLNSSFTGAFSPLWAALEMNPPDPAAQGALRAFGKRVVAKRHADLEAMIADTPFLMGEHPTLADAILVGVARWADFHVAVEMARYPKLAALGARLDADPAVRFVRSEEVGEPAQSAGGLVRRIPLTEVLDRFAPDAARAAAAAP